MVHKHTKKEIENNCTYQNGSQTYKERNRKQLNISEWFTNIQRKNQKPIENIIIVNKHMKKENISNLKMIHQKKENKIIKDNKMVHKQCKKWLRMANKQRKKLKIFENDKQRKKEKEILNLGMIKETQIELENNSNFEMFHKHRKQTI